MRHVLRQKAAGGAVFAFCGKRGDRLKLLHWVSHWNAVAIVSRTNGVPMAIPMQQHQPITPLAAERKHRPTRRLLP